jgi:hypothetical protein
LSIDKENLGDEDISSVKISFQVEKSWISSNDIDKVTVALYRYDGGEWDKLPTFEVGEDSVNVYYESVSLGLSIYAISAGSVTPTSPTATSTPTQTSTPTSTSTPIPQPTPPSKLLDIPLEYIITAVVAIVVIVSLLLTFHHYAGKRAADALSRLEKV